MIDWQRVILNLNRHGYSCAKIARIVSAKQAHIARLARAEVDQPRFNTGMKILQLHNEVCFEQVKVAA